MGVGKVEDSSASIESMIEHEQGIENKSKDTINYLSLYGLATRNDKILLGLALFSAVVHGGAMPAFSFIFGDLLNNLSTGGTDLMTQIKMLSIYLVVLAGITFFASATWNSIFTATAVIQASRFRILCMSRFLGKDIAWFDAHPPAELPSRLQENVFKVQTAISYKAGLFVMNMSMFITGYVLAAVRGWQLFLIILAVVPVIGGGSAIMGKSLVKNSKIAQAFYAKAGAIAEEALNAIRTVTSFNGQAFELKRYTKACNAAKEEGVKGARASGIAIGFVMGSIFISYSLCFYFGGLFIEKDVTNPYSGALYQGGDVMTILFSVIMGTFALGQAAPSIQAFAEGTAAFRDLYSLVAKNDSVIEESAPVFSPADLMVPVKEIFIENVSFRYPSRPEVLVLDAVSLVIQEGQKVAFVGESGSGKSSLISLMERFYDPSSGAIYVNGTDIKSVPVESVRSLFGYVGQEPVLFASSIRNNLRYGQTEPEKISEKLIREACRKANVWDFIRSLPEGLDTYVGPGGGSQISGGQKQRIAIARALLRNPQVLLLDEATSALDNESERQVQETLDRLSIESSLMTISIAHRLSTVQNSDVIFVFKKGVLFEQGTHSELMQRNGLYSVLVSTQAAAETVKYSANNKPRVLEEYDLSSLGAASDLGAMKDLDEMKAKKKLEYNQYRVPWRRVLSLNTSVKKWYVPALAGSALTGLMLPLNAFLISKSLGAFQLQASGQIGEMMTILSHYALGYVGLSVAAGVAMFLQWMSFGVLNENFTKTVRVLIFQRLLGMDIAFFDLPENAPGKLCDTLSANAMKMSCLSGQVVGSFVQIVSALVAGVIIAFTGSVKLAAVMTACIPILVLAAGIQMTVMVGLQKNSQLEIALKEASLIASEALQNMRTVRAFTARQWTIARYSQCVNAPIITASKEAVFSGFLYGLSNSIIFFAYALGFWYGGSLVANENLPMQTMIQTLMGIVLAATGAGQAMAFLPELTAAKTAAREVFALLDTVTSLDDKPSSKNALVASTIHTIEFKNLCFAYPTRPEIQVLKDVSFTVKAGEKVALVGPSGSGKSSLMALLERFYEPTGGEILVNNVPLYSLDMKAWRARIGYVGQEPVLFDLTLEENLRYGNDSASQTEIETVAKIANMDFANSNVKWSDSLGPKGSLLSGGQKQRTAIARALLRDPPVLLLDEATSALDSSSEAQVQAALDAAQRGRTTFTIAHRLSTIQNYDKIFVIASGTLVESGTHAELMQLGKVYHDLYIRGQQNNH